LPQQPYLPDVSPSDFYGFGMLKGKLKKCTPWPFDERKQEIEQILWSIPKTQPVSVFQA
jgi:hypothetical protein